MEVLFRFFYELAMWGTEVNDVIRTLQAHLQQSQETIESQLRRQVPCVTGLLVRPTIDH